MMLKRKVRTGSALIEAAVVYPLLFILMLGIILLGIGVFRYQQVASISREASRWASVHGSQYAQENNTTAATSADIYNHAIAPNAAGMQLNGISYAVAWNLDAKGNPLTNPLGTVQSTDPATGLPVDVPRSNTVAVTVTYSWNTGLFGVIPVSCTSVNTISY
jgi:Flp pilus assembly protein TadG